MKKWTYYLRDEANRPRVTIVLVRTFDGVYSRGVSLCSLKDNPNKAIGRDMADGRACKAAKLRRSTDVVCRVEALQVLLSLVQKVAMALTLRQSLTFKSAWNVNLSPFERKMVTEPSRIEQVVWGDYPPPRMLQALFRQFRY